ncbi:Gp15 family bacteriophage protein [Mogibacterium sp. CM50]|uniref:Gp15 family bacteriophage protein n=1 Tax=Mogibacterium sp. CM50 TaxID=936375 RepID=UPI00027C4F0C|nr:Gp15 family bacteriophage protein [Mogibacterium sp. CM50]EJU23343.1 bacteriophage Gp15 protein [Mogibacterium sp. CM50]
MLTLTLPKSIKLGEKEYSIRSDYRVGIRLMQMFEDLELTDSEKLFIAMRVIFKDAVISGIYLQEALEKTVWFLNGGDLNQTSSAGSRSQRRLYSWNQDLRFIISAVDKTVGFSVRGKAFFHWWDFLSAFSEVGESSFSTIVSQRLLKQKGKQTESDIEWWADNADIAELRVQRSREEQDAVDRFNKLLKEGNG